MKNVQIPYDLFMALLRYHLVEDGSCADEIRRGLEKNQADLNTLDLDSIMTQEHISLRRKHMQSRYLSSRRE